MISLLFGTDSSEKKVNGINQGELLITQYGNYDAIQQYMFYTIQNQKGELTVIDGGWDYSAEEVRKIIRSKGGKVDYWILTHPHPDHIGAFNEIYREPQGIEIGQVYTVKLDYDKYRQAVQQYDRFDIYEKFIMQTDGDSRIHYFKSGDKMEWMGLKLEVFSAYSEETLALGGNIPNEGSLLFRIWGKKESMLFCSDAGLAGELVLSKYGKKLKSDYLQMGHHGNGGCSRTFYKIVHPKAAFFDAPQWLVKGSQYKTLEEIAFMEKLSAKIYTMEGAPHQIVLM